MRTHLMLTAVATLLATVTAGCGEKHDTTHLTLIAPSIKVVQTDEGRPGPSPGDARAFSLPLLTEAGKPAGRLDGVVVISDQVRRGRTVREYRVGTVQLSLAGGNLVATG